MQSFSFEHFQLYCFLFYRKLGFTLKFKFSCSSNQPWMLCHLGSQHLGEKQSEVAAAWEWPLWCHVFCCLSNTPHKCSEPFSFWNKNWCSCRHWSRRKKRKRNRKSSSFWFRVDGQSKNNSLALACTYLTIAVRTATGQLAHYQGRINMGVRWGDNM